MKIAIRGHESRGKEVIQILESLGGQNIHAYWGHSGNSIYYYINKHYKIVYDSIHVLSLYNYKLYTLEEFEKEFPFKIGDEVMFPVKVGWVSGKITGLIYREDKLKYEVDVRRGGYQYVEPHKLSLYPMKEERNITLTLEKAKEWYNKGGELKEIALQAFTEQELNPLPRSWEEFCEKYPVKFGEIFVDGNSKFFTTKLGTRHFLRDKNICPSQRSAEAHLAMIQLEQLRDCWRQGWIPSKGDSGFGMRFDFYEGFRIVKLYSFSAFLSFPTEEMAKEFLKYFRDLIEKAGDLI